MNSTGGVEEIGMGAQREIGWVINMDGRVVVLNSGVSSTVEWDGGLKGRNFAHPTGDQPVMTFHSHDHAKRGDVPKDENQKCEIGRAHV